ncbi:hypothetical protein [Candidatus Chlamydia sanziniae]|uniref:Transcriptional activator protein n=1 Tax=Candidatus Chlamydia sanziniae TaxID=1806891 RepID=A0A1A9HV43_9CHLA|nr:hypothetical protein [Candidatus Chlamydia sanziniae]ANH78567.1 transcriptional activator protein [Candidatus Chlamydia sanziniae]
MKKWTSTLILSSLILSSCLPILGIVIKHVTTAQHWAELNSQIFTLKIKKDHENYITKHNMQLINNRENVTVETLNKQCQNLSLLKQEHARLDTLQPHSVLAQSKEIWARKHALENAKNQLRWIKEKTYSDITLIHLEHALEMDNDDIQSLFSLFNPENPEAPLIFFTHWEMTKQTTPLNNEVWLINAEAISRWI